MTLPSFQLKAALEGSADPLAGPVRARARLSKGDVVVAIDNTPIRDASHLRNLVGLKPVGSTIEITSWRRGAPTSTISVRIEAGPAATATSRRRAVSPGEG